MTLGKFLKHSNIKNDIIIEYRTLIDIDGDTQDIFGGLCEYKHGDKILKSLDGDIYDLEDEIELAKFEKDRLIIWYDSYWVNN